MKKPKTTRGVRLDDSMWSRIAKAIKRENMNYSDFIRVSIENELQRRGK